MYLVHQHSPDTLVLLQIILINLKNITLTSEVGTIGDIVVGVGTSVIISSASTVTVGTVESVSIGTHFSPPTGGTEERGQDFIEGMMRFNTDLNTMEFYNGNEWRQFTYISDIQNSPREVVVVDYWEEGKGLLQHILDSIGFIHIPTFGDSQNFGDFNTSNNSSWMLFIIFCGLFGGGFVSPTWY